MLTLKDKIILITGGTGSLGQHLTKRLLQKDVQKVIVFSRNEHSQVMMEREIEDKRLRFLLGDIRDRDRLKRAFRDVDYVIHCAALKHVSKCERDPLEAKKTNVDGAENIIEAAIDCQIKKVLAISTDKAVAPLGVYGKAKALADDLFIRANQYGSTRFSVIRFGNFAGSNGSVIPLFKARKTMGLELEITHPDMTRFFITFNDAIDRIFESISDMKGGEIFYPKMKSAKILDIANRIGGIESRKKLIGIRDHEKLHEDLIIERDAHKTYEAGNFFITYANSNGRGQKVPENFFYRSDNNKWWFTEKEIGDLVA